MIILRQSSYSKKELKISDKLNLWMHKHATPKSIKKLEKDLADEDKEIRNEAIKKNRRISTASGMISGAVMGNSLYGGTGILPGAAIGGVVGYGTDKLAEEGGLGKRVKEIRETNKKKNRDAVLVADGEMSKEEFIKKWGKEK